ncbi:MAG TPA: thiamine biosynthesis protein ApbE, partial [Stenotrophomonas sp.]|nr:thiamine biosynthesis protein ApbE [Stenotrophomonas sp.]
ALTVLGREQGLALAEREGLAARYLERAIDGPRETLSSAFQRLLDEQAA